MQKLLQMLENGFISPELANEFWRESEDRNCSIDDILLEKSNQLQSVIDIMNEIIEENQDFIQSMKNHKKQAKTIVAALIGKMKKKTEDFNVIQASRYFKTILDLES
jgi:Asp-tRNA(Asn)/Glu-tRNA(Gln) amidotransferase B subunit